MLSLSKNLAMINNNKKTYTWKDENSKNENDDNDMWNKDTNNAPK